MKGIKAGTVDVVIGTHRLLSQDIVFKDLGLLIVDEEQRFGVSHKEKLKRLKTNVDVLTLTATPIPRTLHMSMLGVRDLSVIETPPENRFPGQTYVVEYSPSLVRESIERELARGGQVYYLYNRVQGIHQMAEQIQCAGAGCAGCCRPWPNVRAGAGEDDSRFPGRRIRCARQYEHYRDGRRYPECQYAYRA